VIPDMRKGFTLIEMMVVLVMVAMMLSIVVPIMHSSPSQNVRAAAKQLGRDLEQARTRALASKSSLEIVFNTSGNSYTGYLDTDRNGLFNENTAEMQAAAGGFPVKLPGGISFNRGTASRVPGDTTSSSAVSFTNNRLTFATNGITTPFGTAGTIYLASTLNTGIVAAVTVSGAGSLRVWLYQGGGNWQ